MNLSTYLHVNMSQMYSYNEERRRIKMTKFLLLAAFDIAEGGFGCPRNQYKCNRHCQSIGCWGGYCDAATLWLRCTCARCRGKKRDNETVFVKNHIL